MQVVQRLAAWPFVGGPRGATRTALAIEHQRHRQQQQAGQLGGTGQAVEAVPGLVDRRGEGVEVEYRHRTEIGQGFHDRQGQTGANGRPRHRQRHPPERLPGALPEHPRGLHQALALGQERATGEQVDVGVENQHQHDDHTTGGAHPRQAQAAAEPFAQQRLHRAGEIQQADEDEGQDIGGNGEGQHQRPVQPAPTRELAKAGEPGQTDAQQCHAHTDANHQRQRVANQPRHLCLPQVRPDLLIHLMPAQQQYRQRHQHQNGDGKDDGVPATLDGMRHADSSTTQMTTPRLGGASQYNGSAVLVDDRSHAPRGNAALDAELADVTQSVTGDVPTPERGHDLLYCQPARSISMVASA